MRGPSREADLEFSLFVLRGSLANAEQKLARLQNGVSSRNLNRPVAELICLCCGAQEAIHDRDEDHPGVFRCQQCHAGIMA